MSGARSPGLVLGRLVVLGQCLSLPGSLCLTELLLYLSEKEALNGVVRRMPGVPLPLSTEEKLRPEKPQPETRSPDNVLRAVGCSF